MLVYKRKNHCIAEDEEKIYWCIFLYKRDDDPTQITGHFPLVYNTYDDMKKFLDSNAGKQDTEEWSNNNYIIVTRPIKMYVEEQ